MSEQPQRNVLVVGGSHGISFEIVRDLIAGGVHVTTISRTPGRLDELTVDEPAKLQQLTSDVTTEAISADQFPARLDGFVYSPGSIHLGSIRAAKADLMRRDFELNVVSALTSFQAALPALKASGSGSAVFFSTVAVDHGLAMHSYVAAAKGALQALVRTWAAELAPTVRVNCVAPALTDTPLSSELLSSEQKRATMAGKYPLGRIGDPTDIAAMATFLLSARSSWITGQVFAVDGGMSSIVRS